MSTSSSSIRAACVQIGSQAEMARRLGVRTATVSQWAAGVRPVPARFCPVIEREAGGAVTRQDLRPNDWHLIWPELAQGPGEAA